MKWFALDVDFHYRPLTARLAAVGLNVELVLVIYLRADGLAGLLIDERIVVAVATHVLTDVLDGLFAAVAFLELLRDFVRAVVSVDGHDDELLFGFGFHGSILLFRFGFIRFG